MLRPTTPPTVTAAIIKLCERIAPESAPLYLDVEADPGAKSNECFPIVAARVQRDGGKVVFGWQLWDLPRTFIEAEFHAVWRDPGGALHDITPKTAGITRILFLPDPNRVYEGRQVNNVREALSSAPAVRAFLAATDAKFEFENRGERATQHGKIELTRQDQEEYAKIQRVMLKAELEILSGAALVPERDAPCPCDSGRSFVECHGVA